MTIYNINKGIGWASSGVEYAQAYRAGIFRQLNIPTKFIFTDMFQAENLQHLTENIGLENQEIIWLYSFFTDIKIAPSTYPLVELEQTFSHPIAEKQVNGQIIRYTFEETDIQIVVALKRDTTDCVQRVEYLSGQGQLLRKDYYTYTKQFSEFFVFNDDKLETIQRTFYNENGSIAFEENMAFGGEFFEFPDGRVYAKEDLICRMLDQLQLTNKDILLLDRATGIGQGVFEHKGAAKLAVVIHAEHYNEKASNEENILWNNYYEYQFSNADKVDAFITSTEAQKRLLEQQFQQYTDFQPAVFAIPVGSLDTLKITGNPRKKYSLITASRLASEKHIDWLVRAVVKAREVFPVTLDIYGEGGQRQQLTELIEALDAKEYIQLKGHHSLQDVYRDYELYLTASTSEGFGLTLLEAIGSGLAMIGLDVPYGNQTFIKEGKNGHLVPRLEPDDAGIVSTLIADRIIFMYEQDTIKQAAIESYEIASEYLRNILEKKWKHFVEVLTND
ncbi:accessory Sec system glycosyltransferase GtfA [Streptococcus cameli]